MAGFMSIPRQVRDMVYSYALVVPCILFDSTGQATKSLGEVDIFVKRARWEETPRNRRGQEGYGLRRPTVALLCTSKAIHSEAIIILYGKNRFRLPSLPITPGPSIFKKYAPLFRSVSIRFCVFDHPMYRPSKIEAIHETSIIGWADSLSYPATLSPINQETLVAWRQNKNLLAPLVNLRSIHFFLDNEYFQYTLYWYKPAGVFSEFILPVLKECFEPVLDPARPLGRPSITCELSHADWQEPYKTRPCKWESPGTKATLEWHWRELGVVYDDRFAHRAASVNGCPWYGGKRRQERIGAERKALEKAQGKAQEKKDWPGELCLRNK